MQGLLSAVRAIMRGHPSVQQPYLAVAEPPTQHLKSLLRPRHGVADHQRASALGQPVLQQGGDRLLGLPPLLTRIALRQNRHRHRQVTAPLPRRLHVVIRRVLDQARSRDTGIALRHRQLRNVETLRRGRARQIRPDQGPALSGRQRGRQQHHRHLRLPQPAQPLQQKLRHVHIRRVHLIQDYDLAHQPGRAQHHMLGPGRREQQLIDRPDHERAQQPPLTPQKPLRRRPPLPQRPCPCAERRVG